MLTAAFMILIGKMERMPPLCLMRNDCQKVAMSLPAQLQLDRPYRVTFDRAATLRDASHKPIDVTVDNVSTTGCLVSTEADLPDNALVTIGIAGLGLRSARVARKDALRYGLAFLETANPAKVHAAAEADTLASGAFAPLPFPPVQSPFTPDERFSSRSRLLLIVGASMALWSLVSVVAFGAVALTHAPSVGARIA